MWNIPVLAFPNASHDDALFVWLAASISKGDWLGPYNSLTLAKGPFYPVWIAANWFVGLPLLVSQGLLYASACVLLVRGMRPWLRHEAVALAVFLLLLFDPVTYTMGQLRVMREGIYVPLTLMILACAAWWPRWRERSLPRRAVLAGLLGAVLAAFWCTREEGVWIVPPLALCFGLFAVMAVRADGWRKGLRDEAILALVTVATAMGGVGAFAAANYARYGVFDVVEFKQTEFVSAYGALSRVRHASWTPYVVVPRQVLERVYEVSPAAAELRPHFDTQETVDVVQFGCSVYKIAPCDGEIRAAWFMWSLRHAASRAGHHGSAREARAFYARLAREIDDACAAGRLDCLPVRRSMVPPFRWDSIEPTIRTMADMIVLMSTFYSADMPRSPSSCFLDDCGQSPRYAVFLDMIRTDLFLAAPWAPVQEIQRRSPAQAAPYQFRAEAVANLLTRVVGAYRSLFPWALGIGAAAYLAAGLWSLARRRASPLFIAATIAGAVVAARVCLLAYLDAVAMPGLSSLYLSPAYPALLLFALFSTLAVIECLGRRANRPGVAGSRKD